MNDLAPQSRTPRKRRPTATADFGSGRREAHDASAFYDRFVTPVISKDTTINPAGVLDVIHHGDSRDMDAVADDSVALVVTSPPYFAGKQYEQDLEAEGVPANYFEYLAMLRDVFAQCSRVLEPGGRIAVNIANLGRRPFRSLAGDVTDILADLGLLLRGEVIWWKGRAAGGSCAWGSFQRPANPVLRDVTERIVIASKGRFDRALTPPQRAARGLPSTTTISRDEFMEATTDLWEISPESATRVGHPAPFPVALPARCIDLFTYAGDVVLDPFMGSGSTAIAAVRAGRHFIGYDTDPDYIAAAETRIAHERASFDAHHDASGRVRVAVPAKSVHPLAPATATDAVVDALQIGLQAREVAEILLGEVGFSDIRTDVKPRGCGVTIDFVARDDTGADWAFDFSGGFVASSSGLRQSDALWKSLATAAVLHEHAASTGAAPMPMVLLTTDAPVRGSAGHKALGTLTGPGRPVGAVVVLDDAARTELARYARLGAKALAP